MRHHRRPVGRVQLAAVPKLNDLILRHGVLGELVGIQRTKAGVGQQQAGVDDGDPHAASGIARLIELGGADHAGGISSQGVELIVRLGDMELRRDIDPLYAGDLRDLRLALIGGGHGQAGAGHRIGVAELHGSSVLHRLKDLRFQLLQSGLLLILIGAHGAGAVGDLVGGVARVQQGVLLQFDHKGHLVVRLRLVGDFGVGGALSALLQALLSDLSGALVDRTGNGDPIGGLGVVAHGGAVIIADDEIPFCCRERQAAPGAVRSAGEIAAGAALSDKPAARPFCRLRGKRCRHKRQRHGQRKQHRQYSFLHTLHNRCPHSFSAVSKR